ncbi:MAG: PD-(D/E)XK nuclease family protein [Bacteroidaceae bacterium]|nr:PD-(D/E)XK nuclease family protein [Bacteroidaceae bacterium]
MTPFLKLVANDLYNKLQGRFENTTIVFPNKRASLFFNQYLWENGERRTMWTPAYTSISELFASLADQVVADPIFLTVKLFEVYRQRMNSQKSLDQLLPLMETMLSDFQDIDNNLVEPSKLFVNIADWKEMTDFSFLEEEQRVAIEQFFGHFFNTATPDSSLKTQFRTLWNALTDLYETYRTALLHPTEGELMVYEGMLKRWVVEALTGKDEVLRQRVDARLASETYVMVGFNVLNKTELELFRYIKRNRDAKFYWDYDVAYSHANSKTQKLKNLNNHSFEAGQFIDENIAKLGKELEDEGLFDNMHQPKTIRFIESPTENAQSRYVSQWIGDHIKPDSPLQESAVVLCDERLLGSVLHSMGRVPAVNITMGYPLTNTPIFSLMQVLLELQVHGRTRFGAWRYKYVAAVLKHPLIQRVVGEACQEVLEGLRNNNVVFPVQETFADYKVLCSIFTPCPPTPKGGGGLTGYLADVISMVGHSYSEGKNEKGKMKREVERESVFVAYTIVNRIQTLQEGKNAALCVGDETLSRIILQLMRQATIPFHGEPAVGLQVMGLLETRNLDFRNVVMLSVNEGRMPKSDKRASLIPYTLRAAYGMTTIEKEVSLYAYYYYRLMQRAENITLLYNSSTEGSGKGEMSRFMLQTLAEKDRLFGEGQEIDLRAFTSASDTLPQESYRVVKDRRVMEQLHRRFNAESIFSPSAINTYMKCPLKFYFNYVAGLRPEQDVSEDVDKPMFGTLFHYTMQKLYEPHIGKPFSSEELNALADNKELITQKLNNAFAINFFHLPEKDDQGNEIRYGIDRRMTLNGTQLINRHVIREFVINQMKADAQMAKQLEEEGGHLMVVSQEQKYTSLLNLQQGGKAFQVLLGGYIDRLDLLASPNGNRLRIVDYKTSNNAQTANTLADLFDVEKCVKNYHIMQTFYYAHVLTHGDSKYADTAIVPSLMYPAKKMDKNYSGIVRLAAPDASTDNHRASKAEIEDFKQQYDEAFTDLLTNKMAEIFTPYEEEAPEHTNQGTFSQCADEQNCQYCDFLTFCRRHPKEQF